MLFAVQGCAQNINEYDFSKPDRTYSVEKGLKEISGLAWYKKDHFVTIQDEDGEIYMYDLSKKEVIEKIKFTKDGDFEDIAMVGKKVYVLRSDGTLFKVKDLGDKDQETKKYKTDLDEGNDTEGLCYDKKNDRLLILCKEDPGKNMKGLRAIYSWNLKKKKLSKRPVYTVSVDTVKQNLMDQGLKTKNFQFKPSGIAVHPKNGKVFIVSSVGKVLVELDSNGRVEKVHRLNKNIFEQPEGICFMQNGDLLISNEGKREKGNILLFKYHEVLE